MPGSLKSSRSALPRRFENYVLTRVTGPEGGLTQVAESTFTPSGLQLGSASTTSNIDIGFDFVFDGIPYKRVVISTYGWVALVDPFTNTFTTANVFDGTVAQNSGIRGTFADYTTLVAPWFDQIASVAHDVNNLTLGYVTSATKKTRIEAGLEPPPPFLNSKLSGTKYYRDNKSPSGRRFIIRWNSVSYPTFNSAQSVIRFEVVLYENGTIEFRYAPRIFLSKYSDPTGAVPELEGATMGIFIANGTYSGGVYTSIGTKRFRDFSWGLGHKDDQRTQYAYGGMAHGGSFTETGNNVLGDGFTATYACKLRTDLHWPGDTKHGSIYTFSPPVRKRRVLPGLAIRNQASLPTQPEVMRTGGSAHKPRSMFDDRRTINYMAAGSNGTRTTGSVVNFPTMLTRLHGDTGLTIVKQQQLFEGDFLFTASVDRFATQQFVPGDESSDVIQPFVEDRIYASDPAATSSYFMTGSVLEEFGLSLIQPLSAKTQIKVSLPVDFTVKMFGNSASIYYYNPQFKAWEIPQNASYTILSGGSSVPSGITKGDIVNPQMYIDNLAFIEDARGFGPIGNTIASGSGLNFSANLRQTDTLIGDDYTNPNASEALAKQYARSIQNNPDYSPTRNEVFSLPISHPFLIEKAVIEVPLAFGDHWFKNLTTCFFPISGLGPSSGYDFAGPALTVALLNELSSNGFSQRDVILTGTITHSFDNISEIVYSISPPFDNGVQIRPRGFLSFANPSTVVAPVSSSTTGYNFTGSVGVQCVAGVSNGLIVRFSTGSVNESVARGFFNQQFLPIKGLNPGGGAVKPYKIGWINNFGRGATGLTPSGRSIFGKEFALSQVIKNDTIVNPFYMPTLTTQMSAALSSGTSATKLFHAAIPMLGHLPSPYLVYPGDKLVLAVSKMRPTFFATQGPWSSGSISDDVQLITGSINITLYGSLIREGQEFHDTSNQSLNSDAIHEITIGNEPVLDQFEVEYREMYSGSLTDDYVTGSLVSRSTANGALVTDDRRRVFSLLNARNVSSQTIGTLSRAFNVKPAFERAGDVRIKKTFDSNERFYDSMMPSFTECMKADNCSIFLNTGIGLFGVNATGVGGIIFDLNASTLLNGDPTADPVIPALRPIINLDWNRSFPFEPRYLSAMRSVDFSKAFIANYDFSAGQTPFVGAELVQISPTQVDSIIVGTCHDVIFNPGQSVTDPNFVGFDWVVDINLKSNLTGSAHLDDVVKTLYGFGDKNTVAIVDASSSPTFIGTNHFVESHLTIDATDAGMLAASATEEHHIDHKLSPIIRGWKYGVYSGLPTYNHCYFRRGRYGQVRDMLEQRLMAKFLLVSDPNVPGTPKDGVVVSPVEIKFLDSQGKITPPVNTMSQNLSFEATSSFPYFDGETRNREAINLNTLNSSLLVF